jgi:hypothetical protein
MRTSRKATKEGVILDRWRTAMTEDRIRVIVRLIREHFRLQAEVKLLAALLETAVALNQPPNRWPEALRQGRLQREYRSISEQYASQLAHVEQTLDAKELEKLIGTIPPTQFVN